MTEEKVAKYSLIASSIGVGVSVFSLILSIIFREEYTNLTLSIVSDIALFIFSIYVIYISKKKLKENKKN